MGNVGKCFESSSKPLMLTNGSSAPGAASAYARSQGNNISQQQQQQQIGSSLHVVGKSIFGGNMTKMTSGFKTKMELEMEREKKNKERQYMPVPMEWQVERFEKTLCRQQEEYLDQLEKVCAGERKKKRQDR